MLDIKRMHELELALEGVNLPKCYRDEISENTKVYLVSYIVDTGLPVEDVNYLVTAYFIPMQDILNDIDIYSKLESSRQLGFIMDLSKKYCAKPATILKRAQEVKKIKSYRIGLKRNKQLVKDNK